MRIAILHYHLRPGGVTKVIQNALSSLSNHELQTIVIAGEPPDASMPIPNPAVVEGLGYYDPSVQSRSPEEIVRELERTVKEKLGALPDLWHIHNHCLGKNLALSEVVYLLAQKGRRILLQPHDFAEDGRPDNYKLLREHICPDEPYRLGAHLYPQGAHVHYALINPRDLNFLKAAGVHENQLHYLPNAVSMEQESASEKMLPGDAALLDGIERLYFYPARAIRRKNIGEFLLWAALAEQGERFAIARAPKNPLARPIYDEWVAFAQSLNLPVSFGFGEQWQGDFSALLRSAHALVSTSVAEGFGLAFLEPWLAGRPLTGRNLPEVTSALEAEEVNLSALYQRLDVPVDWIGKERFREKIAAQLAPVFDAYNRVMQTQDQERAIAEAVKGDLVDFGRLDEELQRKVITHLVNSPESRKAICPAALETAIPSERLAENRNAVEERFNLTTYGERLWNIYQTVANSAIQPLDDLNAETLLDQFLAPERFCLLRT